MADEHRQAAEKQFHLEMLARYEQWKEALGYRAIRFLQKVRRAGGVETARYLLKRGKGLSAGFTRLAQEGRADLSVEALVLQEEWRGLFTPEELSEAERRLAAARTLKRRGHPPAQ